MVLWVVHFCTDNNSKINLIAQPNASQHNFVIEYSTRIRAIAIVLQNNDADVSLPAIVIV